MTFFKVLFLLYCSRNSNNTGFNKSSRVVNTWCWAAASRKHDVYHVVVMRRRLLSLPVCFFIFKSVFLQTQDGWKGYLRWLPRGHWSMLTFRIPTEMMIQLQHPCFNRIQRIASAALSAQPSLFHTVAELQQTGKILSIIKTNRQHWPTPPHKNDLSSIVPGWNIINWCWCSCAQPGILITGNQWYFSTQFNHTNCGSALQAALIWCSTAL